MEISGVSIPTVPASSQEPPRDAQMENAVPEAAEGAATNSQSSSDDRSSSGGNNSRSDGRIDERV